MGYRAAQWIDEMGDCEVVLTTPEMAGWTDEALLAEAEAEFARQGMEMGDGEIVITEDWVD